MEILQRDLRRVIRTIEDFPRFGCDFPDVTTLFLEPEVFSRSIDALAERCRELRVDVVASTEARGFLIGAPLAAAQGRCALCSPLYRHVLAWCWHLPAN